MARASECFELGHRLASIHLELVRAQDQLDHGDSGRARQTAAAAAGLAEYMAANYGVDPKLGAFARSAVRYAEKGNRARMRVALDKAEGLAMRETHAAMQRCGAAKKMKH